MKRAKQLWGVVFLLLAMSTQAFGAVEINGIYYNLVEKAKVAEVTSGDTKYTGDVVVPKTVVYENVTYNVTSIGASAFYWCGNLTSVSIPNSVTSIGKNAFYGCSGLTNITIPNSVTSIGGYAFNGCSALTSFVIPNSVTSIGSYAFSGCSITSINIPSSMTYIENYAFSGCSSLTSITIPSSVINIGTAAFQECSGLTSITIPSSVSIIGYSAFSGCSGLRSVSIPSSVTYIDANVFYGCTNLKTVTIGNKIQTLYNGVFGNCPELTDVYCLAENPPIVNSTTFQNSYIGYVTLHVPAVSMNSYRSAAIWQDFKEIVSIEDGSTSPIEVTDVESLTDAIFTAEAKGNPGSETTLTVSMKNTQEAGGYSFDLLLPEGVALAKDNDGDYIYELSDRHNRHSETVNYQEATDVYSFAVLSLEGKAIRGSNGPIWTIRLKVDDTMLEGDYAVKIQNAKYSVTNGSSKVALPEVTGRISIETYQKGDANGDGDVDIADAVCVVNHVVGKETPAFIEKAADANGDNDVDIADAVRIVNYVVGRIDALARSQESRNESRRANISEESDAIYAADINIAAGGEAMLTVSLKNAQVTSGYSFDLKLPEGVTIAKDNDGDYIYNLSDRHKGHSATLNYRASTGVYSFAVLSLQSKELTGNDGAVCSFKLKVAGGVRAGDYTVNITNAKYSLTSGASKVTMSETAAKLTVTGAQGDDMSTRGDLNNDGNVDMVDVTKLIDYIIGKTQ